MIGANKAIVGWMPSGGNGGASPTSSRKSTSYDASDGHLGSIPGFWIRPSRRRWIVKTESNVKLEKKKLPNPPCVVCAGSGRVKCSRCCGRGRTNFTERVMLPRGEWPKWCWDCTGCGMSYCTRCFGTGEKRGVIGFHLPDDDDGS